MLILDPGVIVDLPTLTEKDKEDILKWGVPNKINMIALSFGRKGSDLVEVRKLLGEHAKNIVLISKVRFFLFMFLTIYVLKKAKVADQVMGQNE